VNKINLPFGMSSLPILSLRSELLQALTAHECVVVMGETGSGKTTQLPQLLLEAGYRRVCVTQCSAHHLPTVAQPSPTSLPGDYQGALALNGI
jgi:ABC-type taurine transport system ATPase subunit